PRHLDPRWPLRLHRDLALDDHVERVSRIALAEQMLARIERDELEVLDQRLQRVAREIREQRRGGERALGGLPDRARLRQWNLFDVLHLELGDLLELGIDGIAAGLDLDDRP